MMKSCLKLIQNALAAVVLLAIPAYAIGSLLPMGPTAPQEHLADVDAEASGWHGWNVVEPPLSPPRAASADRHPADVVLLTDWIFTGKTKPSPYQ
jgi:hypothetical protein